MSKLSQTLAILATVMASSIAFSQSVPPPHPHTPPAPPISPPSISISSPAANARVSGVVTISVRVNVSPGRKIGTVRIRVSDDGPCGGRTVFDKKLNQGAISVKWNTLGLPDGKYRIWVTAVDSAGESAGFARIDVFVKNGAPPAPK
jgi:hypothetical protein